MEQWYDDKDFEFEFSDESNIHEYDITSTPNDFNISTLFSLIDNGIIKMPPFQRNYVWDIRRASKLIESILLGLPVPQIFLYEKGKNIFYVIDGQQRLLSIYFFMKQRFPTPAGRELLRDYLTGDELIDQSFLSDDAYFTSFSLQLPSPIPSEKNKYDKLKYETLGEAKHVFDFLRTIRSVVIKQNEPDNDNSSMYEIFNRLNTGGQNLTSQEIRMSLFYSDFYRSLIILNREKKWRELLNQSTVDLHFRDLEILLRSFSMLFFHETYKAPMTVFLNDFSKKSSSFNESMISYLENLFKSFLDSCAELTSEDFYSNNRKFNISLFESVFVVICKGVFKEQRLLSGLIDKASVANLKNNGDFIASTQDSTASKKSVTNRISAASILVHIK